MLTARDKISDKVIGFELETNDYQGNLFEHRGSGVALPPKKFQVLACLGVARRTNRCYGARVAPGVPLQPRERGDVSLRIQKSLGDTSRRAQRP